MTVDELPDILTAPTIAKHQGCSAQTIYVLFRKSPAAGGIPSYQFGRSRRARKEDYLKWLEDRMNEHYQRFETAATT